MPEMQPEHLSALCVPSRQPFFLGRDILPVLPSPVQSFQHSSLFLENSKWEGTNPRGKAMPETGIKAEHRADGQHNTSPWDELVKIGAAQLSERVQGNWFYLWDPVGAPCSCLLALGKWFPYFSLIMVVTATLPPTSFPTCKSSLK